MDNNQHNSTYKDSPMTPSQAPSRDPFTDLIFGRVSGSQNVNGLAMGNGSQTTRHQAKLVPNSTQIFNDDHHYHKQTKLNGMTPLASGKDFKASFVRSPHMGEDPSLGPRKPSFQENMYNVQQQYRQ